MKIIHGECLEEMRNMESNSIDFIVTDPPYGLHFMGKKWDYDIPSIDIWKEALRVCKPGSMMAAFGGSRTYHRLASIIEDSGWEIRDCIMWLQGSGFPKSHNFGRKLGQEWKGYGTALKPAHEPIILAMKPLQGTYLRNAELFGVAGINIDGCRIGTGEDKSLFKQDSEKFIPFNKAFKYVSGDITKGRWPANVILDEEAGNMLDEMSGVLKSGSMILKNHISKRNVFSDFISGNSCEIEKSSGGASRFFYCAKTSQKERGEENKHPTVKPIALMKYIIKLLAPPGAPTLLDPFMGSGSTLLAAKELGINVIGIEKEKEYCEIAEARIGKEPDQMEMRF